jgi:hypothetical protein
VPNSAPMGDEGEAASRRHNAGGFAVCEAVSIED